MATKEEKAAAKEAKRLEALASELKDAGVELTGEETAEELEALHAEHLSDDKAEKPKAKVTKGKFVVLDGNGKPFRTYDNLEDAQAFAKHVGGRVQR